MSPTYDLDTYKKEKCLKSKQWLQCEIHQTGHKCWYMMEMPDKPVYFAVGVTVVKGDQSTAVFRGLNAPLGRKTDRSFLAESQFSPCLQLDIYSHYAYMSL